MAVMGAGDGAKYERDFCNALHTAISGPSSGVAKYRLCFNGCLWKRAKKRVGGVGGTASVNSAASLI